MHVEHLTSVHQWNDARIFSKMCRSLVSHGQRVSMVVADGKGDAIDGGVNILDVDKSNGRLQCM